jgi:beta-mannosidase
MGFSGARWCLLLAFIPIAIALDTVDLTGKWHVTNSNGSISTPAQVPGHIHLDLLSAGLIPDPYGRFQDAEQSWIPNESAWTYVKSFTLDSCFVAPNRSVVLVLDGVDTIADILLNGERIASVENQHVRHSLLLKPKLGLNSIEIRLLSPLKYAAAQSAAYPAPIFKYHAPFSNTENKTFVRKQQSDFGWDWGPALTPVGIWRPLWVLSYTKARIEEVVTHTERKGKQWLLHVKTLLEYAPQPQARSLSLRLDFEGMPSKTISVALPIQQACNAATGPKADPTPSSTLQELSAATTLQIPTAMIDLWWPNGHGNQTLYNLSVTLLDGDGSSCSGESAADVAHRRVGFRTAELIREADRDGSTFYVRLNGRPIFAKVSY